MTFARSDNYISTDLLWLFGLSTDTNSARKDLMFLLLTFNMRTDRSDFCKFENFREKFYFREKR